MPRTIWNFDAKRVARKSAKSNRLAEIAGEYLRKGSKVYVEGSLRTRKWQGQDGQDRYTTEIVASEMQMLDSRGGDGGGYSQPDPMGYGQPQGQPRQPQRQAPQQPAQQPQQPAAPDMDPFDDDIPF